MFPLKTIHTSIILALILITLSGGVGLALAHDSSGIMDVHSTTDDPLNILVFHSYYPTYEWSQEISAGITDVLKNSDYHHAEVYYEFMDAKRHFSPEYVASLAEVYKYKYRDHQQFDLIICSDNHAIDFLTSEAGLEIFPQDIPVVFCGANDYDPAWLENRPDMTGVVESIEPEKTLEQILVFHPATKNLLVVRDSHTHTSRIVTEQTKQAFVPYADQLNIIYLEDMTVSRMQDTVANVSDDTVIFLLLYNRDSEGKEVTMLESIDMISAVSKVPVYSAWDFYLGEGIVGGKLTSAYYEGKLAAEISIRVLDGERPADIPVQHSTYHDFMFDWEQMQRFSIPGDDLPEDSILINRYPSFYELYRNEIISTSVLIVFLMALVLLLMINQKKLKSAQVELQEAKERAEDADRLKSVFTANVSHELRTPLNGIIGFSQMLKMEGLSSEKRNNYADIIRKSGEQLLTLINDILDISSIEEGKLNINKDEFAVNHVLSDLYTMFRVQFDKKDPTVELILTTEIDDESPVIYSDEYRVRQILTNLLGNALKFTDEGSVEFGYNIRDGNLLEFYVKDTGIGIPEDKLDHVLDRFHQVDDASTRKYKGTGLGLSISRGLAQLLGGELRFESEYGMGSTFYFTLPYIVEGKGFVGQQ